MGLLLVVGGTRVPYTMDQPFPTVQWEDLAIGDGRSVSFHWFQQMAQTFEDR